MNIAAVMRDLVDPPRMYVGKIWMNYLGLQIFRILLKYVLFLMRPRCFDQEVAKELAVIGRDGILVLPNYLSQKEFDLIEQGFQRWSESEHVRVEDNKNNTGVRWIHGPISDGNNDGRIIFNGLAKNPKLIKIVSGIMRRKVRRLTRPLFQQLEVIPGESDDRDRECLLHTDRMFPTVKAFLYMNENTEENGAYIYCPGSHKISWARLWHEYEYSIREAKLHHGNLSGVQMELVLRGRNIVSPASFKSMGLCERSIVGAKNTLVISNNMGFHKRGTIQPGKARKQIRLIFHYLEEPWYAPLVRRVIELGRGWAERTKFYF